MNNLQKSFSFENTTIRTLANATETWFCFSDVCSILGDTHQARTFKTLDDDEKCLLPVQTSGGEQEMQVVNEAGLYTIVLRSKSEFAKPFRRWITHDVIPALRKDGFFGNLTSEQAFDLVCEKCIDDRLLLGTITNKSAVYSRVKELETEQEKRIKLEKQNLYYAEKRPAAMELYKHRNEMKIDELMKELKNIYDDRDCIFVEPEWIEWREEHNSRWSRKECVAK